MKDREGESREPRKPMARAGINLGGNLEGLLRNEDARV